MSQITADMSARGTHNPVISSFMTYHPVCNKSNTTGVTSEARTINSSGPEDRSSPSVFSGVRVVFCVVICR